MKVLLLHADDVPWRGAWTEQRWDLIVDLAFAGPYVYQDWSRRCGARVISLHQFAGDTDSYRWMNRVLEHGRGQLLDRFGLDWWELLAILRFHEIRAVYLLRQLCNELDTAAIEWAATRPHIYCDLLSRILRIPVHYFEKHKSGMAVQLSRKLKAARRLRLKQMVEIGFDKWDSGYQLRRTFSTARRANLQAPATLLPSAYSNVTRTVLQYANIFPQRRFLLATTRQSATATNLPANVSWVPLASYAPSDRQNLAERGEMVGRWVSFSNNVLGSFPELQQMGDAGLWDSFPAWLRTGLNARDAWRTLFDQEPIAGVICGDDLNYMSRLPLILAKHKGLSAVQVHHGALDGGFLFKKPYANVHLVKSEMERDYLSRTETVDPRSIVVGAPTRLSPAPAVRASDRGELVFFSQPGEVNGARMSEIYGEVLPRLCSVAERTRRRVIVKLHPFESTTERQRIVNTVLPETQRGLVDIVTAPASEVMECTWCGVGLDSTVALECALQQIPYFFCGWLDFNGIGYLQQFARFGVGIVLRSPDDVETIPEQVAAYAPDPNRISALSHYTEPEQLEQILFEDAHRVKSADASAVTILTAGLPR
jgi:hypothetical protein